LCISTLCEADKQTVGDGVRPQVPQHVRSAPIHLDVKRLMRGSALALKRLPIMANNGLFPTTPFPTRFREVFSHPV
jgi:hypothetical protein